MKNLSKKQIFLIILIVSISVIAGVFIFMLLKGCITLVIPEIARLIKEKRFFKIFPTVIYLHNFVTTLTIIFLYGMFLWLSIYEFKYKKPNVSITPINNNKKCKKQITLIILLVLSIILVLWSCIFLTYNIFDQTIPAIKQFGSTYIKLKKKLITGIIYDILFQVFLLVVNVVNLLLGIRMYKHKQLNPLSTTE